MNRFAQTGWIVIVGLLAQFPWAQSILAQDKAVDHRGDLKQLTVGVTALGVEGSPGPLAVFGKDAFPVVLGQSGKTKLPLVAAGRMGAGRVVAFGHDGYLTSTKQDGPKFLLNALVWAAGKKALKQNGRQIRIAAWRHSKVIGHLKKQGVTVSDVDLKKLDAVDVLIVNALRIDTDDQIRLLQNYIKGGGGLVTAGLGWAWIGYFSKGGKLAGDFRGNRLINAAGIAWTDGSLRPTGFANGKSSFTVGGPVIPLTHAATALARLQAVENGGAKLNRDELSQASAVLTSAVGALPQNEPTFMKRIAALAAKRGKAIVPTARRPLKKDRPLDRVLLTWQINHQETLTPEKVSAHPAAADFPGAVPQSAKRVKKMVIIDTSVPGWHSIGLYAAPGQAITVSIPASAVGKLRIRIGAHKDRIFHHDAWKRAPRITIESVIKATSSRFACAFGGPVYLVVPGKTKLATVAVTISGAVQAPLYVHGKTDIAQWKKTIRNYPAPWAEIGSDRVFLTVPSKQIRNLDDPAALMEVWNKILDLEAELATISKQRARPERFVVDRQISAGYMHSGYPIMAHLDQERNLVDRAHLLKGNWGFFHELGHNHQKGDWTFSGTTEVTCNLFSLYVFEKLCGQKPGQYSRTSPKARRSRDEKYLKKPDFARWKSSPFLALDMYVLMQEQFGWGPFMKVFAEYRDLPRKQRPRNDDQKRDQWMVRFSKTVGRNLGPYFQAWGIPTSAAARGQIKHLPVWMPESMKK